MIDDDGDIMCEMCGRNISTTSHHLIPKQIHSKKYKRTLSKEDSLTLKPTKVVYSKTNGEEKGYKFK